MAADPIRAILLVADTTAQLASISLRIIGPTARWTSLARTAVAADIARIASTATRQTSIRVFLWLLAWGAGLTRGPVRREAIALVTDRGTIQTTCSVVVWLRALSARQALCTIRTVLVVTTEKARLAIASTPNFSIGSCTRWAREACAAVAVLATVANFASCESAAAVYNGLLAC